MVKELAANGHSNRAIAGVVGVAEGTVRNDLSAQNYAPEDVSPSADQSVTESPAQNCAPSPIAAARKAGEDARKAVLDGRDQLGGAVVEHFAGALY